ncbi:MAG: hypothetical protein KKB70_11910 [Proteobacteria bacterium]|nr:hypothetical protein [Pseudomonadota bacterium]
MRIDGNTLNPFWALEQQRKQQEHSAVPGVPSVQGQENASGFALNIASPNIAPPPGLEGVFDSKSTTSISELTLEHGVPKDLRDLLALELERRLGGQVDEEGVEKDVHALVDSLVDAVGYIKDQHGDEAGGAAMTMLLGATDGNVTEDSLSKGLVKILEFVDRNFGINAGNAAIAKFNGSLNNAVNDYYGNGLNEKFMVATDEVTNVSIAMQDMHGRIVRRAATATEGLDTEKTSNEQLLKELSTELEEATDPEEMLKIRAKKAMEAYGFIAMPEPQLLSKSA